MLSSGLLFSVASSAHREGGPLVPQEEMYKTVLSVVTAPREKAGVGTKETTDVAVAAKRVKQYVETFMVGK